MHPHLLGTAAALPPHYVDQETLIAAFRALWAKQHFNPDRVEQLHRAVQVGGRHLALPLEQYEALQTFAARNEAWIQSAVELGETASRAALREAELEPHQVDHIFFVSVTGIATPSIDARLVERLGLRPDVKRTPIFGLGCVGGAAGLARAVDYVKAYPTQRALLLSVEVCSLTLQREDLSVANLIASGLFGDGASAVVVAGAAVPRRPHRPEVIATRSIFYPGTERVMGWDLVEGGFKVVLSSDVPRVVREHVRTDVESFLDSCSADRDNIRHWICHTGGPKVLDAFQQSLQLPAAALARSWASLREVGNLSSASVLFVLDRTVREERPSPGTLGLMMAMGPGFCSELVLLQW